MQRQCSFVYVLRSEWQTEEEIDLNVNFNKMPSTATASLFTFEHQCERISPEMNNVRNN